MSKKNFDDPVDTLLSIGGAFDWITPIIDIFRGLNTLEYEGDIWGCEAVKLGLEAEGYKAAIRSRVLGEWVVFSNR